MKTPLKKTCILIGCLTLSACVFSSSPEITAELTKEDAEEIVKPREDLCAVNGWYGDGECDTFCENTDSDCEVECIEPDCVVECVEPDCVVECVDEPVCEPGTSRVDVCDAGVECPEITVCGATIFCQEDQEQCPDVSPICAPGYTVVEECKTGVTCDPAEVSCGPEKFCQCADNTCPPGLMVGNECLDDDPFCTKREACDATLYCVCDAPPVCPRESFLVAECALNSVDCNDSMICGIKVSCQEGTIECAIPPTCPTGSMQVKKCADLNTCFQHIECGQRLLCEL